VATTFDFIGGISNARNVQVWISWEVFLKSWNL